MVVGPIGGSLPLQPLLRPRDKSLLGIWVGRAVSTALPSPKSHQYSAFKGIYQRIGNLNWRSGQNTQRKSTHPPVKECHQGSPCFACEWQRKGGNTAHWSTQHTKQYSDTNHKDFGGAHDNANAGPNGQAKLDQNQMPT